MRRVVVVVGGSVVAEATVDVVAFNAIVAASEAPVAAAPAGGAGAAGDVALLWCVIL